METKIPMLFFRENRFTGEILREEEDSTDRKPEPPITPVVMKS